MVIYSKTYLNRPIIGPTLRGPFRELEYHYNGIAWTIVWDPNKVIDLRGGGVNCGCGWLERCPCTCNIYFIYIENIHIYAYIYVYKYWTCIAHICNMFYIAYNLLCEYKQGGTVAFETYLVHPAHRPGALSRAPCKSWAWLAWRWVRPAGTLAPRPPRRVVSPPAERAAACSSWLLCEQRTHRKRK